jgi:CobQ/CobB/MinD/ParA nucleotide binding domain
MERIPLALLLKTDRGGPDDIECAVEAAARLGFEITGQGRAGISIRASPEVFEHLFGTQLPESCRQSLPEPGMLVGRRATPRRVPCRTVTCPPQRYPSGGRAVAPRYPSLALSKDGVGKTLVSMILTSRLAAKGFRVVAIDADPNGALADWRLTVWEGSSSGGSRAGCSSARVLQPGKRDNDQDCTPRG